MTTLSSAHLLVLHGMAVSAGATLMWLVGCLSYPLFAFVPSASFQGYHAQHCRRITAPVGVIILCQGTTSLALCVLDPSHLHWLYLVLTATGIFITGVLAAPLHTKLGHGFKSIHLQNLQRVHAWRTALWTLHLCIAVGHLCLP